MSQRAPFSWQSTERLCTGKMTFFSQTHGGLNPSCKHLIFWRFSPFFLPSELELPLVGITVQQGCDSGENAAEQFLLFGIMVIWGYAAYLLRPFHKYTEQRGMKCIFLNTKTTHRCTTIFFSVEKKTDVNNSTERQWPSPCYWDICSHDIPTSTLPIWHSLCHLISLLLFSVSPFSFIHFHPIAFHFLSTLGGEISSMVFASLLSTLSAFPCCASITSLKPPTTRIMPPPLQCCQLACVCTRSCVFYPSMPRLYLSTLYS